MTITPEMVTAARTVEPKSWVCTDCRRLLTNEEAGKHSCESESILYPDDYYGADTHATLDELCRQQHEFITMVRDYYLLGTYPEATKQADAVLALWPDDPTAEEVEG